jgi:hypothetical protein
MWPSRRARLDSHPRFDLRGDEFADAAEAGRPNASSPRSEWASSMVSRWKPSATTTVARVPAVDHGLHPSGDLVHRSLLLGDEDRVGSGCHTGVQRDPAHVDPSPRRPCSGRASRRWYGRAVHCIRRTRTAVAEAEGVIGGGEGLSTALGTPTILIPASVRRLAAARVPCRRSR